MKGLHCVVGVLDGPGDEPAARARRVSAHTPPPCSRLSPYTRQSTFYTPHDTQKPRTDDTFMTRTWYTLEFRKKTNK